MKLSKREMMHIRLIRATESYFNGLNNFIDRDDLQKRSQELQELLLESMCEYKLPIIVEGYNTDNIKKKVNYMVMRDEDPNFPEFIDVTLKISTKVECNCAPYWLIIDPYRQMMSPDVHTVAGMITGPFFSREEAELVLKYKSHHYSDKARVYAHSGYYSDQYRDAYRKAFYGQTGERN